MGSEEDKVKHSKRIRKKREARIRTEGTKKVERVRSVIAKELITSGKFKQRIVKDKRGKKYDLNTMTHLDLIEAINS